MKDDIYIQDDKVKTYISRTLVRCFYILYFPIAIITRHVLSRKIILLQLFLVIDQSANSKDYNFRNFSSDEGFVQPYIYSFIQDSQGYLWVGTGEGLLKYNGFVFKNYTTQDSLADNFITCSIRDGDNLWFGHISGRVTAYDGRKFKIINLQGRSLSPITRFAKSPSGQIYFSTLTNGIFKLDKKNNALEIMLPKDHPSIITFEFLSENELLIGTDSGLKYCKLTEKGDIEIIRPVIECPDAKVTCIQKSKNGSGFFIATENDGLFYTTFDDKLINVSRIHTDTSYDLSRIQCIYEDSHSNLWLGSFGNGLIKLVSDPAGKKKILLYNKSNGFSTNDVKIVYEDTEGNIWSGNYGDGLTQLISNPFTLYPFDKHLYGNNIFSIYLNQQYRWIGTDVGLLKLDHLTGKIISFYGKDNGLPKDTITAVFSPNSDKLWVGTAKNGLFHMQVKSGKIIKYPIGNELESSVTTITGKGDQLWVGTKRGLCNINLATNKVNWFTIGQGGLPHNSIKSLYLDKKNRLWVSTNSSTLAYIQDGKVTKIPLYSSQGILTLGPISEDSESRIWVGSKGNGIFRVDADSVFNITTKEGLLSNYCYSVICDNHQTIWVGHSNGLSQIRTTDFSVKPIPQIENISDKFKFNPNAIGQDAMNRIWFGSDKGLISYDPSLDLQQSTPPVLGITSIRVNDEEKSFADNKIVLSPGKYKIRIEFLGISLREPTHVSYQYKLENFDEWSEITKTPSVTYSHVKEGDYVFILKASSGDGSVTLVPLTISIVIKTPIWKKWWFYLIIVFAVTALIFIYMKWRLNQLLAEKRILEAKVVERTHAIQCQKNKIELQRDLIDKKNTYITDSIKYASHIQNAILPRLELIDKLLPENFILSRPKDIVSGDFYWLAEKDNKIVFTIADCTGHGVAGAFMSLLGITFLNEIVDKQGITSSDAIITSLRDMVIESLHQRLENSDSVSGMDIALCVLDKQNNKLQFTGSNNNLVYFHEGIMEVVKADKLNVGIGQNNSKPFTLREINYKKGDVIYLFSDGFQDQFGGVDNRKYLIRRFYNKLTEIHKLPMKNQKELLEKELDEWIQTGDQTDDIAVMGIRL